jgi:hypothetical protein
MLRGSRPGERRGGRKRGTPNRRTILRDRILAIGSEHPAASQRAFLSKLVKDRKLPADIRIAVAPQCFPPKRTKTSALFCRQGQQQPTADIHLLRGRCRPPIPREAIDPQCRATDRSRLCQATRAIAEGLICLTKINVLPSRQSLSFFGGN